MHKTERWIWFPFDHEFRKFNYAVLKDDQPNEGARPKIKIANYKYYNSKFILYNERDVDDIEDRSEYKSIMNNLKMDGLDIDYSWELSKSHAMYFKLDDEDVQIPADVLELFKKKLTQYFPNQRTYPGEPITHTPAPEHSPFSTPGRLELALILYQERNQDLFKLRLGALVQNGIWQFFDKDFSPSKYDLALKPDQIRQAMVNHMAAIGNFDAFRLFRTIDFSPTADNIGE